MTVGELLNTRLSAKPVDIDDLILRLSRTLEGWQKETGAKIKKPKRKRLKDQGSTTGTVVCSR